ncbi:adenosylcobyric acid synthase (glutamine-hydrolysing) [Hathewaya proteolytica DSM 3090]|uniref:Cobyric acid synthase n=1 Tax=Hathewaya proteolytica DSM 3090 TaxID=1121331 RepID=A0A1M6Q591_9CLOT|nr:cobyric acid synthase [Hathewaya proteolytica]SHK15320.1 adenosylcobyric acid synthase (glutamine-hydrolysing) [Hathewaya proteolytica DSM 3090]
MARIMFQGTGSSVGKSILVTALCRILKQDGYSVVPFKAQNMSLNSYITMDGKEMGRAQVLQAYACGMEPEAYMNPILLKPTGDKKCQVIVNGKVLCNTTAMDYHRMKPQFATMLKNQFEEMEKKFDVVVMEGAGSPAEINLRENDIVNMGMAELVDAPVLLIGDIDKGGVFASLAGTLLLMNDSEKDRIKGTIINKFRGDVEILKPGLNMLEDIIHKPSLGVVPYFKLNLEDEDGAVKLNKKVTAPIDIACVKLPHVSNFTDVDALALEEDVSVRFVEKKDEFGDPDLVIILGSKNTIEDLNYIRNEGLEKKILEHAEKNKKIIGICGGYQILGNTIKDPYKTESSIEETKGMGLLDIETVFEEEKVTTRVEAVGMDKEHKGENFSQFTGNVYGYEIHMGICNYGKASKALFHIKTRNGEECSLDDGAVNSKGNIMGTYIHGIFDGTEFREFVINMLRREKNIEEKKSAVYESLREKELDRLADIVRESLDMDKIYEIIKESDK